MIAGGNQATMTSSAQRYLCGGAFWNDEAIANNNPDIQWDQTCRTNVSAEVADAYAAVGNNANTISALEIGIQKWYAYVVDACLISSGIAGGNTSTAAYQAADSCVASHVSGAQRITHPSGSYPVFGDGNWLDYVVEILKSGISINILDIMEDYVPVPENVLNAIHEFTGNDPFMNEEMIRLYKEAMLQRPVADRENFDIQNEIVMSIIEQMRPVKASMEAEAFKMHLVRTYVDYVSEPVAGSFVVNMRQIPDELATKMAEGTNFDVTNIESMREIRRLFVLAENIVKKDSQVAAYLATLTSQDARDAYLNPIRQQLVDQLVEAAKAKIGTMAAADIAAELNKYDVEVDKTVADNGATVTINDVRLVQRAALVLPPARLLIGLGADRDYPFRLAAIIRLWSEVLEQAPAAADPGELQDGLVDSLIAQHANTDTPTLRVTYVISVDEPGRRVVTGQRSTGILDPLSPGFDIAAEDEQRIRLAQLAEQWWRDNNDGADPDPAAIDAAVRAMLRPILARIEPIQGVLDYWDLPTIGIESITASGNGYLITPMSTAAAQGGGDTIGTAVISEDFQIQFRGTFEGSVSVGTEGFGAYAYFKPELRFDWSSWSLSLFAAAMGVGSPDMFMNCGSESVCMDEGYTSIVRLANLYLQAGIDIGDADNAVKIAAGLISLRSAWLTDAFSDPYNTQFNAHPTLGASTGAGGRVDLTMPLGTSGQTGATTLRTGVIAGQQYSLNITGDGSDAREGTTDLGVYGAASILLHPDSKLHLTLGLSGDYGFDDTYRVTINGGMDVQPWDHLIFAPGAYYSFSTSNNQPYDRSAWDVAAYLRFPFTGIGGSILGLTPYVGFNYGTNMTGSAGLGGLRVDDNSCTSISCPPVGAESADYGNRVLILDFGLNMAIGDHGNIGIGGTYARPESQDENAGAENIFAGSLFGSATW